MFVRWVIMSLTLGLLSGLSLRRLGTLWAPAWTGRWPRAWTWSPAFVAAFVLVVELAARAVAPVGAGPWRYLVGTMRAGFLVLWLGALGSWLGALARVTFARLRRAPASPVVPEVSVEPALDRRAALASTAVGFGAVLRGGLGERHQIEVTDVEVCIPTLPPSLEGVTLVQITDLHVGIFTGRQELDHLDAVVRRARGDLVVLTGDLIDHSPRHIAEGMRAFGRLRAPLGVYGILGNHDHVVGGDLVARSLEAVGVRCLVNAAVPIAGDRSRDEALWLAGVDDIWAGKYRPGAGPNLAAALRARRPQHPVVLLAHNPVFFRATAGKVDLQLSGHTHGGQINPGGMMRALLPFVAGRFARDGSTLYVSRGVGITGPPVRLASRPEVVRIGLTARRRG